MLVKNLVNYRGNEVRNQFVIETEKAIYFQSYQSVVAKIEYVKNVGRVLTLGEDWDYSTTTSKHLHTFLYDYFYKKYTKKELEKLLENGTVKYDENLGVE